MRSLLLAAGLGTRLRPLTDSLPKCLVPIKGKPLLDYWIGMLVNSGVTPILVNLHYFPDKVIDYISKSDYKEFVHTVYEERLLGTAGTLFKNQGFFRSEPCMLVHADNLSKFDVLSFIERHRVRPSYCEITMMTFITPTPESCGIVNIDKEGVVQSFYEKTSNLHGNLANGAVYIIEPSIFDFLANLGKEVIDFSTEVLPHYLGKIFTFHNDIYHRDIGTAESYERAKREFVWE